MIIRLKVFEQTLSIVDTKSVPRKGSKDYLVLHFLFSSDWKDLNKICYLQHGEVSQPIDVVDGLVEVPEWFTQQDSFDVTLFGKSGTQEVPTNVVSMRMERSNTLWAQDAPEPQPSWLAKVIDLNNHPPIPGDNGYWLLWDTDSGAYVESELPLPDMSGIPDGGTAGQLLSKTESGTEWIDPPQSGVQPDWNQNDETAPDHIKNKPFYTGDPVETVLVEESTVQFTDIGGGLFIGAIKSTFSPTVGNAYKISWDGTDYESTCVKVGQYTRIGNLSIDGSGPDTGEPFLMQVANQEINVSTLDGAFYHTISISRFVPGVVVKIDPKYLPDNPLNITGATVGQIAKITAVDTDGKPTEWEAIDIPQSDLEQTDESAADYVKNRPFGNFAHHSIDFYLSGEDWGGVKEAPTFDELLNTVGEKTARIEVYGSIYCQGTAVTVLNDALGEIKITFTSDDKLNELVFLGQYGSLTYLTINKSNITWNTSNTYSLFIDGLTYTRYQKLSRDSVEGTLPQTNQDDYILVSDIYGSWNATPVENINPIFQLSGASAGQIVKITAVDESGKPTAWEAVDMPSGGGGGHWETVLDTVWEQDVINPTAFDSETGIFTCAEGELNNLELNKEYVFFPQCAVENVAYNTILNIPNNASVKVTKLSDTTFSIDATPPTTFVPTNVKFSKGACLAVTDIDAKKIRLTLDGQFKPTATLYDRPFYGISVPFFGRDTGYAQIRNAYQAYQQVTAEVESPFRIVGEILCGFNAPSNNASFHFKNNSFCCPLVPYDVQEGNERTYFLTSDGTKIAKLYSTYAPWHMGGGNESQAIVNDYLKIISGTKVKLERWVE